MEQDLRLIRLPEVLSKTGLGRASVYKFISEHRFPAPVRVGARASAWVEHEINAWLAAKVHLRDAASPPNNKAAR